MMQRAKANMHKLDVIGLTEDLNGAIPLLKFHLPFIKKRFDKWPEANEILKRKKTVLDEQATVILEEWGRPDQELYDIAKVLYTKQLRIVEKCMASK